METIALRIDEWRLDHLGVDDGAQMVDAYFLAQPFTASHQHAEGDRPPQFRAPITGRDMTFSLRRRREGGDVRAHGKAGSSVDGRQTDQLKSLRITCRRPDQ